MRDVDALARGDLPDGLAGLRLDLAAVEGECDRIGHDGNLNKICHCRANTPRTTAIRNPAIHLSRRRSLSTRSSARPLPEALAHLQPQLRELALVVGDLLGRGARLVVGHVARPQGVIQLTQHQCHPDAFLPDNWEDINSILKVLLEAEQCAIRSWGEVCDMTAGKDPRTYDIAQSIMSEEIEHEAWFIELLSKRPSGHFRRKFVGQSPHTGQQGGLIHQ